ncbi:hypothetical protein V2I01_01735 [Micromonospora sp. BRA006-A]|nr:hypothetical protein [Micromonospora sp. BRA006-A]
MGIGTLYRNLPQRRELFEAVYVEEVRALSASAADLADEPPWDALVGWLHRFVAYVATKRALAEELVHDSRCSAAAAPRSTRPASRCCAARSRPGRGRTPASTT